MFYSTLEKIFEDARTGFRNRQRQLVDRHSVGDRHRVDALIRHLAGQQLPQHNAVAENTHTAFKLKRHEVGISPSVAASIKINLAKLASNPISARIFVKLAKTGKNTKILFSQFSVKLANGDRTAIA